MKKHLTLLLILLVSMFFVSCSESKKEPLTVADSRSEFVLDTVVTISTYEKLDDKKWTEIFSLVRNVEGKMSRHIDSSEVSAINSSAGKNSVQVSDDTFEVIKRAIIFSELTDGTFDITIAPILSLWDIGGENQRVPEKSEIVKALKYVNYRDIELKEKQKSVFLRKDNMAIDLGGIAKGYACDVAVKKLMEFGVENAVLDFGGNVYVMGDKNTKEGYSIGVRDPYVDMSSDEIAVLSVVRAKSEAVVSSGDYERFFVKGDRVYHHIFSSKTGKPSDNGVRATTVIAKSAMDADAISTILFITKDEYIDVLNRAGYDFEYLILNSDRSLANNFGDNRGFMIDE